MKRFNLTVLLAALFSISIAVSGCGGDDGEASNPNGGPGYGGGVLPPGGVIPPAGSGPVTLSFSANQIYTSQIKIVGGQINTPYAPCYTGTVVSQSPLLVRYYDAFTNGHAQYDFSNRYYHANSGTIAMSGSVASGQIQYVGNSVAEPGAQITLRGNLLGNPALQTMGGTLTLSPSMVNKLAGQQVIGLALDLNPSYINGQYQLRGGVLIYTSVDGSSCYHGRFLAI